jgi:hypothetical protein
LLQCRLRDLIQDIVVCQFVWNAFIKAYIVGVSVWYQTLYVVCEQVYAIQYGFRLDALVDTFSEPVGLLTNYRIVKS